MKSRISLLLLIFCATAIGFGILREPHDFTQKDCIICHIGPDFGPSDVKVNISRACETCHTDHSKTQSHPTDVFPTLSIPNDMPLSKGKLTCLTCHYVHIDREKQVTRNHDFLRRPIKGIIFCSACHKLDHNRHVVFKNVHTGTYEEMNIHTRIDMMSLECIECHDQYMSKQKSLGAGKWYHYSKKFNHPIGLDYSDVSMKKISDFNPLQALRREIKLFNGKIGCGTCHNVYSKERAMLSINNTGGRLCLQCHRK